MKEDESELERLRAELDATRKELDALRERAMRDALTGLPNRVLFTDRLNEVIARARRREDYRFAVLYLDIDRIKNLNESLGHAAGDRLILDIARRLQPMLRQNDVLARFGGDELIILLDDIRDPADAARAGERVLTAVRAPFRFEGQEVYTSASIGVALGGKRHDRADDLMREADMAMYRAKALGRARVEVFDEAMQQRALRLIQLEADMRRAMVRQEFRLAYQPIVGLESGVINGFEALIRWPHERGPISPAEFIPVAEETGLVIPIGWWVLKEACTRFRAWQDEAAGHTLSISVNVSGRQLRQPDFLQRVRTIIEETGIDPASLKLELTESAIIDDPDSAQALLGKLKELKVRLAIDDFGTGYSSLSYLHRFPIDTLKIDRTFVSQIASAGKNLEICRTITTLARNLGMDVVAEGVETEEQRKQLEALGCEHGQGYLFHKPMPQAAIDELVAASALW